MTPCVAYFLFPSSARARGSREVRTKTEVGTRRGDEVREENNGIANDPPCGNES